jgi:hypothetical protein
LQLPNCQLQMDDENDEGDAAEEQKAPVWVLEDACRH